MESHPTVSREAWLQARKALLAKEKEFTKLREQLNRERRALPWVEVNKNYIFAGESGSVSLRDLFAERSQLIVYHFMFGPNWEEGCPSCSFWADNYDGSIVHLNQRDISFATISRGPIDKLSSYRSRMGWSFNWVSSLDNDFNYDFGVSFPTEMQSDKDLYNYVPRSTDMEELPGLSVFCKNAAGTVFHTYSCYARGLDMLNGTYHHMDLVPKGRDEEALDFPMSWVRRKDCY